MSGLLNSIPQMSPVLTIEDPIEFKYLYEMDLYHHVKEDVNYPSVLFTAEINDHRVAFWQPSKVAPKMQAVSKGHNVVLLRISDEGHFGESSVSDDFADRYAFLLWQPGNPNFKLNQN